MEKEKMFKIFRLTYAIIIGLIILILGHGLFTTLLPVRLHLIGSSTWVAGAVAAAYSAGLMIGSFHVEKFIVRIGHIRAYATFVALLTVVTLLTGMYYSPWLWIFLRFIGGACLAGGFVVIESWLLSRSTAQTRGQVLALYMTAFYAAQASGQFFLNLSDPGTIMPFCLTAILCAFSIIPIAMTRLESPHIDSPSSLSIFKLYKISPLGITGCILSGMILGCVYGLLPLFVSLINYSTSEVATIMGATIFGGMLLQYPIGRLSDHLERRNMIITLSFIMAFMCIIVPISAHYWKNLFLLAAFIFGGLSFSTYSVCISHACDYLKSHEIVAATQGMLIAYGTGAIIGPIAAPEVMRVLGPNGLFIFFIFIALGLGFFGLWRKSQKPAPTVEEQQSAILVPRTTPVVNELTQRTKE